MPIGDKQLCEDGFIFRFKWNISDQGYSKAIEQISRPEKDLEGIKTELACENASQVNHVIPSGFKPETF